jgi:hypothetical protein
MSNIEKIIRLVFTIAFEILAIVHLISFVICLILSIIGKASISAIVFFMIMFIFFAYLAKLTKPKINGK